MKGRIAYIASGAIGWAVVLDDLVFREIPYWWKFFCLILAIGLFAFNQKAIGKDVDWWIDRVMGERGRIALHTWDKRKKKVSNWVCAPFMIWFLPLVFGIGALFNRD